MDVIAENRLLLTELEKAQAQDGYITQKAIVEIADLLGMPAGEVYQAASFYSFLYLEPLGRHLIQICESAPCHVAGAGAIVEALEQQLGIKMGETTGDGRISLRFIQCCGQCQDAPVLIVDGTLWRNVSAGQISGILDGLK